MTIPNGSSRHSIELQLARARQATTPAQVQYTPGVFDGASEPEGQSELAPTISPPLDPQQQAMSAVLDGMNG